MSAHITGPGDPHSGSYRDGYAAGEAEFERRGAPRAAACTGHSDWARGYLQAWQDRVSYDRALRGESFAAITVRP